jgi:glyoxylase-like metal-dependent hydrolase (beta-lactamase superfamily II)
MGRVHLAAFNVDPDLALTSLTRLATLPVEIAVFGHGEPVRRSAARRLADAVAAVR